MWHTRLRALVLMVMLLVAMPSATAQGSDQGDDVPDDLEERVDLCIITYRFSPAFDRVYVAADQALSPEEWDALIAKVDANGDGNTTSAEVDAYEEGSNFTRPGSSDFGELTLELDGTRASSVSFITRLYGFEGPTNETRPRLVTEDRTYRFNVDHVTTHTLAGGLYLVDEPIGQVVEEFVVIDAPPGWVVATVNGTAYHTERVSFASFDTRSLFTVSLERNETGGERPLYVMPGPTAAPALGLLVALVGWAARRRAT